MRVALLFVFATNMNSKYLLLYRQSRVEGMEPLGDPDASGREGEGEGGGGDGGAELMRALIPL